MYIWVLDVMFYIVMQIKFFYDCVIVFICLYVVVGLDLYVCDFGVVFLGCCQLIKMGVVMVLFFGYYGQIFGCSGLVVWCGIVVFVGVIDNDYCGEIGVVILNMGDELFVYFVVEKVVQFVVLLYNGCMLQVVEQFDDMD